MTTDQQPPTTNQQPPTTNPTPPREHRHLTGDQGSVTIWMLLWIPVLTLGLATVIDYGAAIHTRAYASDAAFGSARTGAVHIVAITGQGTRIDQTEAATAAHTYIDQLEPPPRVELTATVDTTPTTVTVTVTATYQPRLLHTMTATFTRTETAELQIGQ